MPGWSIITINWFPLSRNNPEPIEKSVYSANQPDNHSQSLSLKRAQRFKLSNARSAYFHFPDFLLTFERPDPYHFDLFPSKSRLRILLFKNRSTIMRNLIVAIPLVCLAFTANAQLPLQAVKSTYLINFDNTVLGVNNGSFAAGGTAYAVESPADGQLDRGAFQVSWAEGAAFNWPDPPEDETGGGGVSAGGELLPGVYAYTNDGFNRFLGVRPDLLNFSPGAIIFRVQNTSGSMVTQFDVGYRGYAFNSTALSSEVAAYWSNDGQTWTAVPGFGFTSTLLPSGAWENFDRSTCIMGTDVAHNEYFYLKWVINDGALIGLGGDEVGIDNISILGRTPVVGFVEASSIVAEGTGGNPPTTSHNVGITMEAPPVGGSVGLRFTTEDGTAQGGSDYTAMNNLMLVTFNLTGGCYPQTKQLSLNISQDNTIEANENFFVHMSLQPPAAAELATATHEVIIANDDAPANGRIYSRSSGNWSNPGIWNTNQAGMGGTEVLDPDNILGAAGPQWDITIQKEHVITLDGGKGLTKLTIEKGPGMMPSGQLLTGAAAPPHFLRIYGSDVIVDGIIGNGIVPDGVGLEFHGIAGTIGGADEGEINLHTIRKDGLDNTVLNINKSLNLRGAGTVLYNKATGRSFSVTIPNGVLIEVPSGSVSIDGEDGLNGVNSYGSLTVNGALDIQEGDLFLRTDNSASPGNDISYRVGPTGWLHIGGQMIGNEGSAGQAVAGLRLDPGALLEFSGAGEVLPGLDDMRNNLDIDPASTVEFSGFLQQILPAVPNLGHVIISGGGGKSLSGNMGVFGMMELNSGIVSLGDYNLTVNPGGSLTTGSSISFIQTDGTGFLRQLTSLGAANFPVGNSSFNPVVMSNSGVPDWFSVRVEDLVRRYGLTGEAIMENVVNRTWRIDEDVPGGSVATVALQWNENEELMGFDRTDCLIARYSGGWITGAIDQATSVGGGNYLLSDINITTFSPFIVSSPSSFLPIELAFFHAFPQDGKAVLKWETASEAGNSHFMVERSADLRDFEAIGRVEGQGNSSQSVHYQFIDHVPLPSVNYYRLRQVDYDGQYSLSPVRAVEFLGKDNGLFLYPLPAGNRLNVSFNRPAEGKSRLLLFNAAGQLLETISVEDGAFQMELNLDAFPTGMYLLRWESERQVETVKLVK
jgi:hypothetical protein